MARPRKKSNGKKIAILVRLDADVHARLRDRADRERRTLQSQAQWALEQHVEERDRAEAETPA